MMRHHLVAKDKVVIRHDHIGPIFLCTSHIAGNSLRRQEVVVIEMEDIVTRGMKHPRMSGGRETTVLFVIHDMDSCTALRVILHHLKQHLDATVLRAVVDEDILNMFISLFQQ